MYKGRLLASLCAMGLIFATPALAQTNSPAGHTAGHGMTRGKHLSSAHAEMMTHHRGGRRPPPGGRGSSMRVDTSQNAAVDRLNDQSLQAARQGNMQGGGMQGGGMAPAAPAPAPAGKM